MKSFEGFNYNGLRIEFFLEFSLEELTSFYGISKPNKGTFFSIMKDSYLFDYPLLMNQLFPSIKSAYKVFKTYIELCEKYPQFLTDSKMGAVYKLNNPKSVEEFEINYNKFNSYNVEDINMLVLLITLLQK
jgi:hypothetical protein